MLARIRKAQNTRDGGFTLIELLVVVIIIGILAAIAIPTFLRQRESGWRAEAESNLRNGVTNARAFSTNNGGSFTGLTVGVINDGVRGIRGDNGAFTPMSLIGTPTVDEFCIQVTHPRFRDSTAGTFNYRYSRDSIIQGTC